MANRPVKPTLPSGIPHERAFGDIIAWGVGPDGVMARLGTIDRETRELAEAGLTIAIAKDWARFYEEEYERIPQNETARLRVILMDRIAEQLQSQGFE